MILLIQRANKTAWFTSLLILGARVALPETMQQDVIVEDLERRAMAAFEGSLRARDEQEAEKEKAFLRPKLEAQLRLDRLPSRTALLPARLWMPSKVSAPVAAVVVLDAHSEPDDFFNKITDGLTGASVAVLTLDVRKFHSTVDLLPIGVTPETLMQQEVRAALRYLSSRPDIDAHRIGLIGEGLSASLAAALNPQFSAIVLIDAGPDLRSVIAHLRDLRGDEIPDACYFVPGLVRYAAPEQLIAMIAPRPLLEVKFSTPVLNYSNEIYSSYGREEYLRQVSVPEPSDQLNYEACMWLTRWLRNAEWNPHGESSSGTNVELPYMPMKGVDVPQSFRLEDLQNALGEPLPQGKITFRLKVAITQSLTLTTQEGFALPVSVFRPGTDGGGGEVGTLIAISDGGQDTLADDEVVQEAVRRNWIVWAVDARGLGKLRIESKATIFLLSLWLNETFAWRQAQDVQRIIEGVGLFNQNHQAALYARGPNSSVIAAMVDTMAGRNLPGWIAIREGVSSFWDGKVPFYVPPFGMRGVFDIADAEAHGQAQLFLISNVQEFIGMNW
jgi:hypothetical protein